MAETSTRASDAAAGLRKLFERPDGQPYEFWIQLDLTDAIKQTLERDILVCILQYESLRRAE